MPYARSQSPGNCRAICPRTRLARCSTWTQGISKNRLLLTTFCKLDRCPSALQPMNLSRAFIFHAGLDSCKQPTICGDGQQISTRYRK